MADEKTPTPPPAKPEYSDLIVQNPPCPVCYRDRFHREECPQINNEVKYE